MTVITNYNLAGFDPIGLRSAASYNGSVNMYFIPSGDSTATFIGDMVSLVASANAASTGDLSLATPRVAQLAAGVTTNIIVGCVTAVNKHLGVAAADLNLNVNYRPASKGMYVYVADDPDTIFSIQADDSALNNIVQVGHNCDIATVGSGSTYTGRSAMLLSTTSGASGATLPFKVIGMVNTADNFIASGNLQIKMKVMINDSFRNFGTVGV